MATRTKLTRAQEVGGRGSTAESSGEFRRITSKGQVTIPGQIRKRYGITTHTKLMFLPQQEGFLIRPAREESDFSALAGSASKHWTVDAMLKRLEELRKENV